MDIYKKRAQSKGNFAHLPPYMNDILSARNITTDEQLKQFLHPNLQDLHSPFLFPDMEKAVQIIKKAAHEKQSVTVYGDYDVDGICASTVLYEALSALSMDVSLYIPNRHDEGYGLNEKAVREIAKACSLLITVDCGITSVKEVKIAKELGMTVIITDHHTLPDKLPQADALLNPLIEGYPFPSLCGTGVALKLFEALHSKQKSKEVYDLVAIATIADMVPLLNENRILVHYGLQVLSQTKRKGLLALMRIANVQPPLQSQDVAFMLAPRLNACGRMKSALLALELLCETDLQKVDEKAVELENLNQERKALSKRIEKDIEEKVKQESLVNKYTIVQADDSFDMGVVGLAAGRVAEKYGYPTVVLSLMEDFAVGSARSAGDVDIYAALKTCQHLFLRFGGHKKAAGLTILQKDIPLFKQLFDQAVQEQVQGKTLYPIKEYDALLPLSMVNKETYDTLQLLEPCGMGNPSPVFLLKGAEPLLSKQVGANNAHLKLTLRQNEETREGIAFFMGDQKEALTQRIDALFTLSKNVFNGKTSYQLMVRSLKNHPLFAISDKKTEEMCFLQDFCTLLKNNIQFPLRLLNENQLHQLIEKEKNVLLLARTKESVRQMATMYGALDYYVGEVSDPRAYSAIACNTTFDTLHAPYQHVVLVDGQMTKSEGDKITKIFPNAYVYAFPASHALRMLYAEVTPTLEELRTVYKCIKTAFSPSFLTLLQSTHLNDAKLTAALQILDEIELIQLQSSPFFVSLLPFKKADPMRSTFYVALLNGKEACC